MAALPSMQPRVWHYFKQISAIPRASFQEKAVSDYVYHWALSHDWECWQDDWHNVFIRKSATPGMEQAPTIMLQAHLDMVCQRAAGVQHDFSKDAIRLIQEGDYITTGGTTTLGADDGIGVALAMAVLEDDTIPHPELEVLLTTVEEDDMSGALHVDASTFHARYLLNLDNAVENQAINGSCGGYGVMSRWPVSRGPSLEGVTYVRIQLTGLPGGHSGEDIHRGRGNAIGLLTRILLLLYRQFRWQLVSLTGGTFRLAIPREAEAIVALQPEKLESLTTMLSKVVDDLRHEYPLSAQTLQVTAASLPVEKREILSLAETKKVLTLLSLLPDGIQEMNGTVPGVVQCSVNVGEVSLAETGDCVRLVSEIRAPWPAQVDSIFEKIRLVAELAHGTCQSFAAYPGWPDKAASSLADLAKRIYQDVTGKPLQVQPQHTGLECGCLLQKKPGLDALSMGPDCEFLHSPQERLSISSTNRMYQFLLKLLSRAVELP